MFRLHDEERGATATIVAISLMCLLGMLALTFDLGRGVSLKRNMVNGADAGALAAARECGLGNGEVSAMGAADELVTLNNAAAEVTGFQLAPGAQCGPGSLAAPNGKNEVTVTVSFAQDYVVAQILGFEEGTVTASATAEWTLGVANPVPLKLDMLKVDDCTEGKQPGYTGPECYFEFEKDKTGPQRGWLNFPQGWPIQGQDTNPKNCGSQQGGVNELREYIRQMGMEGPSAFQPVLWDPPPTYVCAAPAVPNELVQAMETWLNDVADMNPKPAVYFPVVADPGVFPWITTSGREAYPVVKFVGM
ncbi:MAG TPA: pilus assembly protein TadG-related protein, partial [Actinomycetota bacterium]|nr:pilus assembly protein TadG-related protein [Actinomycetota bacterium]